MIAVIRFGQQIRQRKCYSCSKVLELLLEVSVNLIIYYSVVLLCHLLSIYDHMSDLLFALSYKLLYSQSLPHSLPLFLSLSQLESISVCVFISLSFSLFLSLSLSFSLSLSLSFFLSFSLSHPLSIYLFFYFSLSLFLSLLILESQGALLIEDILVLLPDFRYNNSSYHLMQQILDPILIK